MGPSPSEGWYYSGGGQTKGPVSLTTLMQLLNSGAVSTACLVWRPGFDRWMPASDAPGLLVPPAFPPDAEPRIAARQAEPSSTPAPALQSSEPVQISSSASFAKSARARTPSPWSRWLPTFNSSAVQPEGLGGCLAVFVAIMILNAVLNPLMLFAAISENLRYWEPLGNTPHGRLALVGVPIVGGLLIVPAMIIGLVLVLQRKPLARAWWISTWSGMLVFLLGGWQLRRLHYSYLEEHNTDSSVLSQLAQAKTKDDSMAVGLSVWLVVFVLYWLLSRRVKNTFRARR